MIHDFRRGIAEMPALRSCTEITRLKKRTWPLDEPETRAGKNFFQTGAADVGALVGTSIKVASEATKTLAIR